MKTRSYHFIDEIREQPQAVRRSLEQADRPLADLARDYEGEIERVVFVGCGDPYMLGIAATYAFESWTGLPAESIEAGEFVLYRHRSVNERTLVVLISSSGKTVKVIDAARISKRLGAPTFALTNLVPSPITEETKRVIQTQAGWSDSFPTKQTTTALAVLYALAFHWADVGSTLPPGEISALRTELYETVPSAIQTGLALEAEMEQLAGTYMDAPIYSFIGSGPNWATAQLSAAKMKETSQSRSEATNLEEYAHLHSLSLRPEDPVFVISSSGAIGKRNRLVCQHIEAHGGQIVIVGTEEDSDWEGLDVHYVQVPIHSEIFGPLVAWIPLQLFAYHTAIARGRNPDRPPERGVMDYLQKIIYTSTLEGWFDR